MLLIVSGPVEHQAERGKKAGGSEVTEGATEIVVRHCRSCGKPIYWGVTAAGKRCPFDVVEGEPTQVSHFATCPDASKWSKKK